MNEEKQFQKHTALSGKVFKKFQNKFTFSFVVVVISFSAYIDFGFRKYEKKVNSQAAAMLHYILKSFLFRQLFDFK